MFYVGGVAGMRHLGAWLAGTTYFPNDVVSYSGSSYVASATTTGNLPTSTAFWQVLAAGATRPTFSSPATVRAQASGMMLGAQTASTATVTLTTDGAAVGAGNIPVVSAGTSWLFKLNLISRRVGVATGTQGWSYQGVVARDTGGTARLVGTPTQLATWSDVTNGAVTLAADTTANYLQITVNPAVATAMLWHAVLTYNELVATS